MTDWSTKKLGDVLDYEQPGKYIVGSNNYSDEYETPVLTAGKTFILGNTDEKENIFPADKLPVIIFDDFTTATQFVDFQFKVKSSAMKILYPKKDQADAKYLFYLMQTLRINHATHKRYWISVYSKIEIPIPPLEIQKKVVEKLEELLGKINEAKLLRTESQKDTDDLLSSELHKIFRKGKKKGWEKKKLEEIIDEIKSGFACGKQNEVENGIIHLRTHNIDTEGNLNFNKTIQIPKDLVNEKAFGLKVGDVLFNNTNSTELVGKTALVKKYFLYAFSNHITRIKVNKNVVYPEWITYVFNTFWRDKFFESICSRWVGQSGINQTTLKKIKILIPPISEQKKIIEKLNLFTNRVDRIKKYQSETKEEFLKLEKAILAKAFSGKK